MSTTYQGRRQEDGWPIGVTAEQKAELVGLVRDFLRLVNKPVLLWVVAEHCGSQWSARGVVLDWRYACVERALRAAGAEEVWRLELDAGDP